MTPRQARAARAMLGLDIKTVCTLAKVGKRTLTEFERGYRAINSITEGKILAFYITRGILFSESETNLEGITFIDRTNLPIRSDTLLQEKIEYEDILDINSITQQTNTIIMQLKDLESKQNISSCIIVYLNNRLLLNQKQVANHLGCSPSFINAVVVGKRTLPLKHASKVQAVIPTHFLDVKAALHAEKKGITTFKQTIKKLNEYLDCLEIFGKTMNYR